MFGRKGLGAQPPQGGTPALDGREWVKAQFARNEQPGAMEFSRNLGVTLFDDAYNWMKSERGVRIEDITAMLASVGGHLSLAGILDIARQEGLSPQNISMTVIRGGDGEIYFFGDAPNWLLAEAPYSIVSLLFGAAHQHGAAVSMEMLHEEMRRVAQRAGGPDFLTLDLPEAHQVDSPLNWARAFVGPVSGAIAGGMAPALWRPIAVGFALQQAIEVGRQSLDPMTITRIALQCALRTAKIDPARVAA